MMKNMVKRCAYALVLLAPLYAFAQDDGQSQPPSAGDVSSQSFLPVPSMDGRQIQLEEFKHRRTMGDLSRQYEEQKLRLEIERTTAEKERIKRGDADTGPGAGAPRIPPVLPSGGRAAVGQAQAEVSVASEIALPATIPHVLPPRAVGLVGESVILRVDRDVHVARVGQSVGGYVVKALEGRTITLESLTLPQTVISIQVP